MKHKVKKLAGGGLSGIAETASSLMNDVDSMTEKINYGTGTASGPSEPVGFSAVSGMKKGGQVKAMYAGGSAGNRGQPTRPGRTTGMGQPMKKGGSVSSASKRADGCAVKGKTRGRMV
jgi:hypothetical protein